MRALVVFATAVLALDAVLLAIAAWWVGSRGFGVAAAACAVAAFAVAWSWRWYRQRRAELDEARHELARDVRELAAQVRRSR